MNQQQQINAINDAKKFYTNCINKLNLLSSVIATDTTSEDDVIGKQVLKTYILESKLSIIQNSNYAAISLSGSNAIPMNLSKSELVKKVGNGELIKHSNNSNNN